jgi:hypothetical protein
MKLLWKFTVSGHLLVEFPNYEWSMKKNLHRDTLNIELEHPHLIPILEELVNFLRKSGVTNIQDKMSFASDIEKFRSTIAELHIARLLAECDKKVALNDKDTSPDMTIKDDGDEFPCVNIEVRYSKIHYVTDIFEPKLTKFLKGKGFRIDIILLNRLAPVTFDCKERNKQEDIATQCWEIFERDFVSSDPQRVKTLGITSM